MGHLRSCYKTQCHFWRDDPAKSAEITYYFVPSDRPLLGFPTIFGPRVWERRQAWDWPELGEEHGEATYVKGGALSTADGRGRCGTREQWLQGCLTTDPLPPINPNTGLRSCCSGPLLARGGVQLGGFGSGADQQPGCGLLTPPVIYAGLTSSFAPESTTSYYKLVQDGHGHWEVVAAFITSGAPGGLPRIVDDPDPANWVLDWGFFSGPWLDYDSCAEDSFGWFFLYQIGPEFVELRIDRGARFTIGNDGFGGLAFGGFGFVPTFPPQRGRGGLAFGGSGQVVAAELGRGGLAFGGSAQVVAQAIAQGGVALGGVGQRVPLVGFGGGAAWGGTGSP